MYALLSTPSATTPLGATLFANKTSASFRVWAPNASAYWSCFSPTLRRHSLPSRSSQTPRIRLTGRPMSQESPQDTCISSLFKIKEAIHSIRAGSHCYALIPVPAR